MSPALSVGIFEKAGAQFWALGKAGVRWPLLIYVPALRIGIPENARIMLPFCPIRGIREGSAQFWAPKKAVVEPPLLICDPSTKRWGPLRRQGLCSHCPNMGSREGRGYVAMPAMPCLVLASQASLVFLQPVRKALPVSTCI